MKVVLISCASSKRTERSRARNLYLSPLFCKSLAYAESLRPDAVYILSAKHGLVGLDEEIEPYDLTLNTMSAREVRTWADGILAQLGAKVDVARDHFIVLAGMRYRKYLVGHFASHEVPMMGMRIGEQLQFLKRSLDEQSLP